jgi:hypothetical protein
MVRVIGLSRFESLSLYHALQGENPRAKTLSVWQKRSLKITINVGRCAWVIKYERKIASTMFIHVAKDDSNQCGSLYVGYR